MPINPITLYIDADVLLGILTDWNFTLLALPSDQRRSSQEATELIWTMGRWTLCWVHAHNAGISTELELWLCNKMEQSTMGGAVWEGRGDSPMLIKLFHIIQC